jgi:hypothetical protein
VTLINKTSIGKMTQRAGRSRNIPSKQQRAKGIERVFKMQTQSCALDPSAEKRSGLRVMDCRKQRKDRRAAKPMQICLVRPHVGGFYARGAAFMRASKAEKHGFLPAPQGSGRKSVITPSMLDQKCEAPCLHYFRNTLSCSEEQVRRCAGIQTGPRLRIKHSGEAIEGVEICF